LEDNLQDTTGQTEEYDGSTWTVVNAMNTARHYLAGCRTQTAAISFGGGPTSTGTATEQYDGTSWIYCSYFSNSKICFIRIRYKTASLAFGGAVSTTQPQPKNTTRTLMQLPRRLGRVGLICQQTLIKVLVVELKQPH
jgi:hypothetical protein